jgi:tetratricopeptide (TPR) repeat protein
LVRRVPAPFMPDPLEVSRPLRILGLVSSPRGLPRLDVEAERERLHKALGQPLANRRVQLQWVPEASWDAVHERLLAEPWHVLHFIGHGDFDYAADEGVIAFVGEDGWADLVGASRLASLLSADRRHTPRLVVLNSCSSAKEGTDLFSGTAAALVHRGIQAVAAMQFAISDKAAIRFAQGFYTALTEGHGIDEAVRNGRIAIMGLSDDTLEWVTPVLYLRGATTHLFTFTDAPVGPAHLAYSQPAAAGGVPARTFLSAAEDPAYVDGLSALLAGRFEEAVGNFTALQARFPDDPLVRERLQKALSRKDHAFWYDQGVKAAEQGDWERAIAAFERISAADTSYTDAYSDAADRLGNARREQRRKSLIDDVQRLHAARQWKATIMAGLELAKFDPATPDPDGLITQAREALAEEALAARYATGLQQFDRQDWLAALDTFTGIEQDRPGYRDSRTLLEQLRQRQRDNDNIQRVAELQDQLRAKGKVKDWAAVAIASYQLAELDAGTADPDGLATQARQAFLTQLRDLLKARQHQHLAELEHPYAQARAAEDRGDWTAAVRGYDEVLQVAPEYLDATARRDHCRQAAAAKPPPAKRGARARAKKGSHPAEPPLLRIDSDNSVRALSWHPDGRRIAVGTERSILRRGDVQSADVQSAGVRVYDISGSKPKEQLAIAPNSGVYAPHFGVYDVVFSPDGTRLAAATGDAGIWDAASGEQLRQIRQYDRVVAVAFSPDGTRLATAASKARIWNAASGKKLCEVSHEVSALRRAIDTRFGTAKPAARSASAAFMTGNASTKVVAVAFSPDGTRLATGSEDGSARVWDAASGKKLLEIRHDSPVTAVAFSPDGYRLATGSEDKSVRIWSVADL